LDISINLLPGDVLIASAFVSYAGPFSKKLRDFMIRDQFLAFITQNKIPMSVNADPVKLLIDESTAAKWNQ
jgi:dynein heavy chain